MNPIVLWMRHGTCDDGLRRPHAHARPDSPLTAAGAAEAEVTARELERDPWRPGLITGSPLPRAQQTASIVAARLSVRLSSLTDAFAEWHAPHCVLGLGPSQYPPEYLTWRHRRAEDPDSALPGGESLSAFARRAEDASVLAADLATGHGGLLIISHRLLIGAVAAIHNGIRQPPHIFTHASDFRLAPAHVWAAPTRESM